MSDIEQGTVQPWRNIFHLIKVTVGNTNKQSQLSKIFYQIIFKLSKDNSICVFFVWVETDPSNRLWHKYSKEAVLLVFMSVFILLLHQAYEIETNIMLSVLCSESYKPIVVGSQIQLKVAWY